MALNVVMLGASRSGKTSILASMLNNVRNPHADNNVNKHFYVRDVSDYAGLNAKRQEQVGLQENVDGMQDLLTPPIQGKYVPKMTNLSGTTAAFTYAFDVTTKLNNLLSDQKITIKFYDIPGELCSNKNFGMLKDEIRNAQLLIVAVDVPSLMYRRETGKKSLNTVMNCPNEVYDAVEHLGVDCCSHISDENRRYQELGRLLRMVIFVPIKCEYWLQNGRRDEIDEEIRSVYKDVIARCKQYDNMQTLILPVETIGSCLFDHHSDEDNSLILLYASPSKSKLYISEDEIDGCAAVRCEHFAEGQVRLKNGVIYDLRPGDQLISAKERAHHPYCYDGGTKLIPYTWFKPVSSTYAPKYCDLLFCQILRFSIMDFAKRTGHSAREAFDNAETLWDRICALPDFFGRLFSGHTAAYSDVLQVKKFQASLMAIDLSKWLEDNPIEYLVNREDGYDM